MSPRFRGAREAALIGLALAALGVIHVCIVWIGPGEGVGMVEDRVLLDTDSYMWMNRATHIAEGGGWFEHTYPRINPPEGHVQHWTRPLDGILLLGGVALGLIWGFRDGLYFWGLVLPPMLHLATLLSLAWAVQVLIARRVLPASRKPLLMLVFLLQLPAYQIFLAGRPDHHALMGLLFVLYLGFWMRVLLGPDRPIRAAVGLGLVSALAIWVSVEALLYVTLGMVGLGFGWLVGTRRLARDSAVQALALVAGLTFGILVEWGPRSPPVRQMDTLSVAHLGLTGLTAGFWLLLWAVTSRGRADDLWGRLVVAGLGATAVLVPLAALFPEFFGNPLGEMDPLYHETRLSRIKELQPLLSLGEGFWGGTGVVVLYAGLGTVTFPYLVVRLVRSRSRDLGPLWLVFAMAVALFLGLSVQQLRWTDYLGLSALIPYTLLASSALEPLETRLDGLMLRIIRPLVLVGFVVGPTLLGMGLMGSAEEGRPGEEPPLVPLEEWAGQQEGVTLELRADRTMEGESCSLVEVSRILSDPDWFDEPELVLAHADYGPEVMFRTHHSVLSIPNHRPQPGYRFTHEVLRHPAPDVAAAMLEEWGVGIVVLCVNDITSGFFSYPEVESPFVEWLAEGGVPPGYTLHVATPVVRIYRRDVSRSAPHVAEAGFRGSNSSAF